MDVPGSESTRQAVSKGIDNDEPESGTDKQHDYASELFDTNHRPFKRDSQRYKLQSLIERYGDVFGFML